MGATHVPDGPIPSPLPDQQTYGITLWEKTFLIFIQCYL